MHVCFVNMPIEFYSPVSGGAISTVIMHTAKELIARGHRVSVLTRINSDETYQVGDVTEIKGRTRDDLNFLQRRISSLRWHLSHWDWPFFEYYLRSVANSLARLAPEPDVVVVFNDLVSPAYLKRVLPNAKVAVWLHNEWQTRFNMAETLRNTDVFLTCSDYIRQWTASNHNIPISRITTAHNGVDSTAFTPRVDYLDRRDTLGVLFLGRIDPNKGPDIVADAVAALRAEGLPIELTVAGGLWFYGHGNECENPYFRVLKTKMDIAGARYLGHVTRQHVPEICRSHDVVCVLSRSQEPYSLVAVEAMASGCAVIASKRGGLPEACGGAGISADPDDLPTVVRVLRSLATNHDLLKRLKQKSVARAARATWASCAAVVETTLCRALSSGDSRGRNAAVVENVVQVLQQPRTGTACGKG